MRNCMHPREHLILVFSLKRWYQLISLAVVVLFEFTSAMLYECVWCVQIYGQCLLDFCHSQLPIECFILSHRFAVRHTFLVSRVYIISHCQMPYVCRVCFQAKYTPILIHRHHNISDVHRYSTSLSNRYTTRVWHVQGEKFESITMRRQNQTLPLHKHTHTHTNVYNLNRFCIFFPHLSFSSARFFSSKIHFHFCIISRGEVLSVCAVKWNRSLSSYPFEKKSNWMT